MGCATGAERIKCLLECQGFFGSRISFNAASRRSIDVESLGVTPVARRDIPIAGAATQPPDRAVIVLNPGVDHGALVMEGIAAGDAITGSWHVTAYAFGPSGRFRMRRAD